MSRRPLAIGLGLLLALGLLGLALDMRGRPHVPVRGWMGFGFGRAIDYQACGFHTGQDWFAPAGSPIFAVSDGRVVYVGPLWISGPGVGRGEQAIVIDHGGWTGTYSHNRLATVQAGEMVERGAVIGEVGSEGFSRGPHLHFEHVAAAFSGDWQAPFSGCQDYRDPGSRWAWY